MSGAVYRLRLSDGTTWVVVAKDAAAARAKAETYFPHDRVSIEESRDGSEWETIAEPPRCSECRQRDVMPYLGCACAVSCGLAE